MGPETAIPLPEPPSLGTVPPGTRGRALLLSGALYGLLAAGVLSLLVAPAPRVMARRTLAVALDDMDFTVAAPPPPAGPAGGAGSPAPSARVEPVPPLIPTERVLAPATLPEVGAPASPGSPGMGSILGGAPGGQAGGVAGGQVGGTPGGQGTSIQGPRFDAAYLQNPPPDYPSLSRRLGEEGRVILRVLVSPEGRAEQVELRQSSGHARLDQAALGTVRRWRFVPARRGSDSLAAWVLVPLTFTLDA
ncbi:MAG TPA: energy transducer TonB [Holophagaceae bacterium]|nr:energy transducer TonB [Holophagaceae bacterium]